MAEASSSESNDYSHATNKTSPTKPTNLDEQMDDSLSKSNDSRDETPHHEDATPDDKGGNASGTTVETPSFNHQSEERPRVSNTSASDVGASFSISRMSQNNTATTQTNSAPPDTNEEEKQTDIGNDASSVNSASSIVTNGTSLRDSDSGVSMSESQQTKPKPPNSWIDVLGNGNLLKRVLREGEGVSTRPTGQAQVRMKVRGSLSSGGVVERHGALEFTVGDGDVIQALDIIAPLMAKGETCQIKTGHQYAYGELGRSPDIPPNSTLMYDLELVDVKRPLDYSVITEQELLNHLNKKRGRGNDLFQRKEYSPAVHSYSRAVGMMARYKDEQSIDQFSPEISDLWVRCLNNLAAAQMKIELYNEALESVNKVLQTDPENVKALYRCGKVYMIKGDFEQAVHYLQKASVLNPDERAIQAELQRAIRKRDQSREQEKAMYKRMMTGTGTKSSQKLPGSGTATPPTSSSSWNWKHLLFGAGLVAVTAVAIGYFGFKQRK